MNRETKTFKTPLGKELIVKSYMTARERENLLNIFDELDKEILKKQVEGKNVSLKNIESAKKYIEIMVVSYDESGKSGTSDNKKIIENLLDSPIAEYDFVIGECIKASTGDFQSVKSS